MKLACVSLVWLVGCVTEPTESAEPAFPNQLTGDKSDGAPLWGGLTSITIQRWSPDPCNDGRSALGDDPVIYEEWARTRAAIRNVCFEVWMPGVTDTDNPDFWKILDVQVHYRYGHSGAFTNAYVPSIDRRGNNRRYAWALDFSLDPTVYVASLPQIRAPSFEILSENGEWAYVSADLELYFTVNGQILQAPAQRPFAIRYQNYVRTPKLAPSPSGYVLHDIVTCDGARFGSGAGFFAADLDANTFTELGDSIPGVGVSNNGATRSMTYSTQITVPNQSLPGFVESGGLRITPDGTTMRVELDVYDRTEKRIKQLTETYANCNHDSPRDVTRFASVPEIEPQSPHSPQSRSRDGSGAR
jgi:hypothetical protein